MATEFIKNTRFRPNALAQIDQANTIIEDYQAQGFSLTLRQLYYQFVARGLLANTQANYNSLGKTISHARLAGMIDWEAIEDRTRGIEIRARWSSPAEGIQALRNQYHIDMWQNQPTRVEVWIEKEALTGVIGPTCRQWDVPYLACRGYVSQSEQWRAYRRIREYAENEIPTVILHFGDHDPSGIDMTRDNTDRLKDFLNLGTGEIDPSFVTIERLALNMDQVRQYNPPENPAKQTDSRFEDYKKKFGMKSWELDALEPRVLAELISTNVQAYIDTDLWNERLTQLKTEQATLDQIIGSLK